MNVAVINKLESILESRQQNDIALLVTGDFCPVGPRVSGMIDRGDYRGIFREFQPFIEYCDISVTNLESPLTLQEKSLRKAGPVLKGSPETAGVLHAAGFNLVTLANNHILDYGQQGLEDTLNAVSRVGIKTVGAGTTAVAAHAPLCLSVNGLTVAFLNVTEHEFSIATGNRGGASLLDEVENYYRIRETRSMADILVLIVHGGHEGFALPSPRMVRLYRYFAALGVDAVIGHHAHVFSGYEIFRDVPIFYSLGNFVFDKEWGVNNCHEGFGALLLLNKKGISSVFLVPYYQFLDEPGIAIHDDQNLDLFKGKMEGLNRIIRDRELLQREFELMAHARRIHFLSVMFGMGRIGRSLLRWNIYPKSLLRWNHLARKLNMVRCQSHRDILVEVLRKEYGPDQ